MFRTVRMQFLESLEQTQIHSLEELNAKFLTYAESSYNLRTHSSLGEAPMDRFLRDKQLFKFVSSPEVLDNVFLREANRKVNKDATIALLNKVFEVPQSLISQSITVRYDPENLSEVYVKMPDTQTLLSVFPVQSVDNSKLIRRQNEKRSIDFAELFSGRDES